MKRLKFAALWMAWIASMTSVHALDTDGGGISDVWEFYRGTGPLVAWEDPDQDGFLNEEEYYFDTNPLDATSRPRVNIESPSPDDIQVSFFAPMGQWFEIEVCDDLLTGNWNGLYGFLTGNNSTVVHSENPTGMQMRFFQVVPYGADDFDIDGLDTFEEHLLGTLPEDEDGDTDNDGMGDAYEFIYQLDPLSPVDAPLDADGDLLSNVLEAELGLNPRQTDSDGDGTSDADEDRDFDGLTNIQEVLTYSTDPAQPDTDLDTLPDGWEVDNGFSPTVPNGSDGDPANDPGADPDGDGLTNTQEADHGTLANNADTDGDGVSDAVEVAQGSNPKDPNDSQPPPEGTVAVNVTFGDDSGSHSEKYRVRLIPLEGDSSGYESRYRTNRVYGQPQTDTFQLPRGSKYRVELEHAGTNLSYEDDPRPDYDYILEVDTSQGGIVLEDDEGMAGEHGESYYFYAAGKSATLYVPLFEWVTPKESPDSAPNDSGDGQNEFTYDAATPGILTIDLKVLAKPTGVAQAVGHDGVPFYERCVFTLPAIGDSTFAWDEANPDGMAEASGEHLIAKATYTTLPASNSDFGLKQTQFQCDSDTSVLPQGDFEVFYMAQEKNHQGGDSTHPNWFHYYKQNAGGGSFGYDPTPGARSSSISAGGDSTIKIGDYVHSPGGEYITTTMSGSYLKATGWSTTNKYYAHFVGVLAHERQHANGEVAQGGPADPDSDWLATSLETNTSKTNPNDPVSASSGVSAVAGFTDDEVYAGGPVEENGVNSADTSQDWANPGTNCKP